MRGMPVAGTVCCRLAAGAVLAVSIFPLDITPTAARAKVRRPLDVRVESAMVGSATTFLAIRLPPKPPPKPASSS